MLLALFGVPLAVAQAQHAETLCSQLPADMTPDEAGGAQNQGRAAVALNSWVTHRYFGRGLALQLEDVVGFLRDCR